MFKKYRGTIRDAENKLLAWDTIPNVLNIGCSTFENIQSSISEASDITPVCVCKYDYRVSSKETRYYIDMVEPGDLTLHTYTTLSICAFGNILLRYGCYAAFA